MPATETLRRPTGSGDTVGRMTETVLLVVLFIVGVGVAIGVSYRVFMRGDSDPERVASRLPKGFKPDWSWRRGDTYVGYERAHNRIAIVDYPHSAVLQPSEVRSVEPVDESVAWIVHRWLVLYVAAPPGKMRVWFGLSAADRDCISKRLREVIPA